MVCTDSGAIEAVVNEVRDELYSKADLCTSRDQAAAVAVQLLTNEHHRGEKVSYCLLSVTVVEKNVTNALDCFDLSSCISQVAARHQSRCVHLILLTSSMQSSSS